MNDLPRRKRLSGAASFALAIAATLLLGGLAGVGSAVLGDQPGAVGFGLTAALITAALATGFVACVWWWRQIDEAAREAHKWAWWWGGSGGMAVGGVIFLTLIWRDEAQPLHVGAGADAFDIFAGGMLAVVLFQLAGYALAWAGWWLKHR